MIDEELKQLLLDYQEIFSLDAGKRVLADLATRLDGRITPQGMPDCTGFELGKREAFLYIVDKVNADPDQQVQENMTDD